MADLWYYTAGGQQAGPVSEAQLRQLAAGGHLNAGDMVWHEGMPQWAPASTVPGLVPEPVPRRGPVDEPPRRYADRDDDDRRSRDEFDRDELDRDRGRGRYRDDEEFDDRPRRRRRQAGMSTGAKVAIGLGVGGGVLLLLIVVIVVIVIIANSDPPNQRTFSIEPGETKTYFANFRAGQRTEVRVNTQKNTDIDLFIFEPGNPMPIVWDDRDVKDCYIVFQPRVTGQYRLEVRNINQGGKLPVGRNRCTLRWDPP